MRRRTCLITEGKALLKKYDVHNPRSGEVSALLRGQDGGQPLYEQVQHSELELHAAKKAWDEASAAYQASRQGVEQLKRSIVTMAKAAGSVSQALGGDGVGDILTADANDEASIAARVAGDIKNVPFVGQGFEQGLTALRHQLLAREAAHQEIVSAFFSARCDFAAASYKAASIFAQAKAFLGFAALATARAAGWFPVSRRPRCRSFR